MLNLKKIAYVFFALSFVGLVDALYLTVEHYTGGTLKCAFFTGCTTVTSSSYATVFGIPVALLGVFYYLTLLCLSFAYIQTQRQAIVQFLSWLTIVGALVSFVLLFLQIAVIKAICLYCVISATTSSLLFAVGMYTVYRTRNFKIIE